MRPLLERLGGFLPAAIALALPTVWIPNAVDSFILPRTAIVIGGACAGVALALLTPRGPGLGRLRLPLLAAVVAACIAFAFSVNWGVSFAGAYYRYESLPERLSYLALLAVPVWLLRDERSRRLVISAFVLGTAIASAEAIWQLGALAIFHSIDYRPDGNVGNAGLLGALIAMALPLAIARGLHADRFGIPWWIAVALMIGGIVASTSRAGALGALAGSLALIPFAFRGRRAAAAGTLSGLVAAIGLWWITVGPLGSLNNDPARTRLQLWPDAVRMIAARPLTGWGEDSTGLVFGRFLSADWSPGVIFDRAHSGPLDIAATQGLLGLAALAWVQVTWLRGVWRWRFTGSVGALAAAAIGYSVWVLFNFDWAPATGAFWLLAGTAWSTVRAAETDSVAPVPAAAAPAPGKRALRWVGAVTLAAGIVCLSVLPVLADIWYFNNRLDLAVAADPVQGRYHWELGKNLVLKGSASRGLTELKLAARLGESDPQVYVDIGDAEQGLGLTADALAAYRGALTIDPFYAPARQRLAGMGLPPSG
jgi:O-antigen ligase